MIMLIKSIGERKSNLGTPKLYVTQLVPVLITGSFPQNKKGVHWIGLPV